MTVEVLSTDTGYLSAITRIQVLAKNLPRKSVIIELFLKIYKSLKIKNTKYDDQ